MICLTTKNSWRVERPLKYERRQPRVKVTADICDTIVNTLAIKGLFGGNPETIYNTPIDIVMNVYNYSVFINEYQETEMMLNSPEGN